MGAERRLRSRSARATEELGARLGRHLAAGTVVALEGDLGAGKTLLARGIARGLGLEEGVASPTYTLLAAHEGGRLPFHHYDAWMEGREKAFLADGGDEWLGNEGVAVVEWAERVADWLPEPRLAVRLGHLSPTERSLHLAVVGDGPALGALLEALELPEGVSEDPGGGNG